MVHGPRAGLALLRQLDTDGRVAHHHRLDAVRAHLLEMAGDHERAIAHYRAAARRTTSIAEQRYLTTRANRLTGTLRGSCAPPTLDNRETDSPRRPNDTGDP
jgi:predicted RNA polymerase sigma factor